MTGLTFEELGIDRIFVDEADLFKNLGYTTKMNRIAGLPNTESNRALDMYMKTRYLSEQGGGIVFATGTPISNTMAEMYTLSRYLAPELLEAAGVSHFDAWAANFGEAVTALELAPDGTGYRMHTRFAKFVNLPELLSHVPHVRGHPDGRDAEPAAPEHGRRQAASHRGARHRRNLKEYVSSLVERAQRMQQWRRSRVWTICSKSLAMVERQRSICVWWMRAQHPAPTPKSARRLIISPSMEESADKRLTQTVFCDISTPNPDQFNVYDEIRAQLIARGVPEKEIAYIHDADTDAKKKTLFDAVNAGRVRILLGSTEKDGSRYERPEETPGAA